MKDFLKQEIDIGDQVVYAQATLTGRVKLHGPVRVLGLTPKKVRVNEYKLVFPDKVVVVNELYHERYL